MLKNKRRSSAKRYSFLKKKFLIKETDTTKVKLYEVRSIEVPIQITKLIKSNLIRLNLEPLIEAPLRKSDRVSHQLDKYYNFLIWDGDPIELDENDEDLITYMDAMQRSDSDKWLDVIKSEMKFMKIIDVWTLVDPFEKIRPMGCK